MAVAGDPRSRDLAFAALLKFARWFNPRFEAHASRRETIVRGSRTSTRAVTAPQVLVANQATVALLGRLGRRLAYLPTDGDRPADPDLVRLGRHLIFLGNHWAVPGQQLVASLADILGDHWATSQSELERQSLAALDAFIEPPVGLHGFEAAALAERDAVGPLPSGEDRSGSTPWWTGSTRGEVDEPTRRSSPRCLRRSRLTTARSSGAPGTCSGGAGTGS
jgi:hypothetical protein